ncbi:MAG: NAD/FAD-utilizing enzyme [Agarilytica sp.]
MKRHYYVGDDLQDLKKLESELESAGLDCEQIHVLSNDDADVEALGLPAVDSFSKKDVLKSGFMGFGLGIIGAGAIMFFFMQSGLSEDFTMAPALFLALGTLGFFTWEGGLWGIQKGNSEFERFEDDLAHHKHVFFVDVKPSQEKLLDHVLTFHPQVSSAGEGSGASAWSVGAHKSWHKFVRWAP